MRNTACGVADQQVCRVLSLATARQHHEIIFMASCTSTRAHRLRPEMVHATRGLHMGWLERLTLFIKMILSAAVHQPTFLGPVIVIMLLVACGETHEAGYATVDTLESGVILVSNRAEGMWDEQSAWRLVDEVTVGAREGTGPEVFGLVTDFDVDGFDRVYVLDVFTQEIRVFGRDGAFVRTIGGRGGGPGEFRGVNGMTFDPSGRLWVMNQGNVRYSVFDTSGTLLQEPRRPALSNSAGGYVGMFSRSGDLYDVIMDRPTSVRYDTVTNQFVDSIPYPALPPGTPFGWGHRLRTPDGWWLAVASEYRLHRATLDGDTIRIVERAHDRIRLPEDDRDSAALPPGVDPRERVRVIGDVPTPRYRRVFERLFVDEEDNLWVMLARPSNVERTTLDVFDREGRYLGAVAAPHPIESLPPPVIRRDKMVFLVKDDLDVP